MGMRNSAVSNCQYRHSVRRRGPTEDAACRLLAEITGIGDEASCRVNRDACEACCASYPPSASVPNPVVASLLYRLCGEVVEQGGAPGLSADDAARMGDLAEFYLAPCHVEPATHWSCDVLVCCEESSGQAERAVLSVLEQDGAIPIVHLVDDGGGGDSLLRRFAGRWNVVAHSNPIRKGLYATLHDLLPVLRSEFVAVQDVGTISHPDRIASSVSRLVSSGAEILAAPLMTPSGAVEPQAPGRSYRRYVPSQTLVFRRASLVDMGGIAARRGDAGAELFFRAFREGRRIAFSPGATVTSTGAPSEEVLDPSPRYREREGSLRHHAIGFPEEPVECDVVLPFHGHLHYLRQSMPSVLEQEGAEAVVHLIDDGTPGGAEEVLRYWGSHPRVRTYRNTRNLGQFLSFNNVVPYLETRLVAVQDADDISRPRRCHRSGNLLRLADAEVFGGWTRQFYDRPDDESPSGCTPAGRRREDFGRSAVPRPGVGFFLQNPTAMLRVGTFESLRGFSDYGDLHFNKCGLDTEFYARAYYAGVRFAISREVVVDYRLHPESAVNNAQTGWGSPARLWSETENHRRFYVFQQGPFDPRVFGALGGARGHTERLGPH